MEKIECKKVLIVARNKYIERKRELENELDDISNESFIKQKECLEKLSFHLLESNNECLKSIGSLIVFKCLIRKANKKLLTINNYYLEKYLLVNDNLTVVNNELNKVLKGLDFLMETSDNELRKYMSYKIK